MSWKTRGDIAGVRERISGLGNMEMDLTALHLIDLYVLDKLESHDDLGTSENGFFSGVGCPVGWEPLEMMERFESAGIENWWAFWNR